MSAVTYGERFGSAAGEAAKPSKKGWFARAFDRLMEARMEHARAEVERHLRYLPYSLDEEGNRLVKRGRGDMPFGG